MSVSSGSDPCIATVSGVKVRLSEVSEEAARIQSGTSTEANLHLLALENLIDAILIAEEARRLALIPDSLESSRCDSAAARSAGFHSHRLAERALTGERLLAHWTKNIKIPGKPERKAYYESHPDRFTRAETIRAKHLVSAEESATHAMRDRVVSGDDFAVVAKESSDCPENGGDLGYLPKGVMVEEFDEAVFPSPVGVLTPVFRTRFGYHVAMVTDRKPPGRVSFNEADEEIRQILLLLKQDQLVAERMEQLRRRAVIRRGE